MLSSCARAATAEEAAYRIDYPLAHARHTRVIAFDEPAEQVVRAVSEDGPWGQAEFYRAGPWGEELITLDGERRTLDREVEHSDSVIMVATNDIDPEAVAAVGMACRSRSIMTAGLLLLGEGTLEGTTLAAIRPHARVLLVPADYDDLFELLRGIRA
jgi:hypothetical protein